jgi:hypothetical protein
MEFKVCSRRWGHFDNYTIQKTANGWWISHLTISGDCNKKGKPYLYNNFDQDGINYPADLGGYLEYLWEKADSENWSDTKIQPKLNILARWVSKTEFSSPRIGILSEYK